MEPSADLGIGRTQTHAQIETHTWTRAGTDHPPAGLLTGGPRIQAG